MKIATLLLCLLAVSALAEEPRPGPVNRKATPGARRLLDFLHEIQGKHTLSGQHNFIMSGSRFTDRVQELAGKRPLLWGSDFSFAYRGEEPSKFQHCGPLNLSEPGTKPAVTDLTPEAAREQMVKNAIQAWRAGHIVTLMWHACPPGMGDACDGKAIWTLADRPSQAWWALREAPPARQPPLGLDTNAPRDRPDDEVFAYEDFWPGHETVDVLAADVYRVKR